MLTVDTDRVNEIITSKCAAAVPQFVAEQSKYGIKHVNGGDKISLQYRKRENMINRITIKIKKTMIYREKGAGRGYGGRKGSKWVDSKGNTKTTDPNSLGKAGTGNRPAAPWFNPIADKLADDLANALADEFVEIAFNNLNLR